jgi:hypothetical protein
MSGAHGTGFVCHAEPGYNWLDVVKKLQPHEFIQWLNRCSSLKEAMRRGNGYDDDSKVDPATVTQAGFPEAIKRHCISGLVMDASELAAWAEVGVEMRVTRIAGLASTSTDLHQTIYQVSVANVGLMQIQTVEVLEDTCTDELQRWLDQGWRILAVCPPNDARRPTYVVGHFEQGKERR